MIHLLNTIGQAGLAASITYVIGLAISWNVMDVIDDTIGWLKKPKNLAIIFLTPLIPALFAALAMI